MANSFNKEEVILFEQVLEKFDADNTVAKKAQNFRQPGREMQRRGDTVWRPSPQISTPVDGLDVTSSIGSVTQLSVPATLSQIKSVPWEFDALEARDPMYRDEKAKSAAQALSAVVNRSIADLVANTGSLVVARGAALSGYSDVAEAEALMVEQDLITESKTMVLNARDYNNMAASLATANRDVRVAQSLGESEIGRHAGFDMFRTSYLKRFTAAAGGAITVNGANQRHVPVSTSTAGTGETANVDNRFMNLTVSATANVVVGDSFTIAGVNAVSHINKTDTGQLKTFRVVEVVSGTVLKISPAIVDGSHGGATDAEKDYANVTATPANTAAITWLNGVSTGANIFFANNSIEVFGGNLAFNDDMAGVAVMRQSTDSGIEIIFAKQGDAKTGKAFYRLTIFYGVTNLNPEYNGILIRGA